MDRHRAVCGQFWLAFLSVLCAAGIWAYASRILIPYQRAEAAAHGRPRGNLSDLYPRWLGARELLLRGRDPYSSEVTREIQTGYYGRPIDPSRSEDPTDEERFAYPVYVAFLLAPTVRLPFEVVEEWSFWMLLTLTIACVPLCSRILGWSPPRWTVLSLIGFTVGSPAVMQGLKLRQLSVLVAVLVFAALALLVSDHMNAAGCLLALATIKPQLVWLLLLWLAAWTLADWKRRYRLMVSFLVSMAVLLAGSELLLPHWIPRFWEAIHEYRRYTGAASVLGKMASPSISVAVAILGTVMIGRICWRERKQPANTGSFAGVVCLVLSASVLIVPNSVLYNQILLLPAMFWFLRDWRTIVQQGISGTLLLGLVVVATLWPWMSSIPLAVLSFVLPPETAQRFWTVPLWTVWLIPVSVSALMLLVAHRAQSVALDSAAS